jgi:hypothetical protein
MMSPLIMEELAAAIHAERLADSEARRIGEQIPTRPTAHRWPRLATVGAVLTCLATVTAVVLVLGQLPQQF